MTESRRSTHANLAVVTTILIIAAIGPYVLQLFNLLQLSTYSSLALATLGIAFVWGYLGILNFGHAAFFGVGAYSYAITAINLGETTLAIAAAILLPTLLALLLGYFLFYGKVGDVYLAVITLCITLVLFNFGNSTADPSYHVGVALLGGFNGMSDVPPINWPGHQGDFLSPEAMFRLCFVSLAAIYALLCALGRSRLGRMMIAVRENELRSELLGYDVRTYKIIGLSISAAVAGLGGALLTATSGYVGPTVFGLPQASQFLLWVIAGGLGTLAGPLLASFFFQYLATFLGTSQVINTSLIFGAIIIVFVIVLPKGILPTVSAAISRLRWPGQSTILLDPHNDHIANS